MSSLEIFLMKFAEFLGVLSYTDGAAPDYTQPLDMETFTVLILFLVLNIGTFILGAVSMYKVLKELEYKIPLLAFIPSIQFFAVAHAIGKGPKVFGKRLNPILYSILFLILIFLNAPKLLNDALSLISEMQGTPSEIFIYLFVILFGVLTIVYYYFFFHMFYETFSMLSAMTTPVIVILSIISAYAPVVGYIIWLIVLRGE